MANVDVKFTMTTFEKNLECEGTDANSAEEWLLDHPFGWKDDVMDSVSIEVLGGTYDGEEEDDEDQDKEDE